MNRSQCVGNFTCTADDNCGPDVGNTIPREWLNSFYNFDNLGYSLISVFHVSVLDNFMDDVCYQCMDSVGEWGRCHWQAKIARARRSGTLGTDLVRAAGNAVAGSSAVPVMLQPC